MMAEDEKTIDESSCIVFSSTLRYAWRLTTSGAL
jgi:hypothetical protein